MILKTNYLFSF